ncbi:MAG: hypothetical protein ACOYLQ_09690 [Hyphomicrobiaceae bacterium]
MSAHNVPLAVQIAEIEREVRLRRRVYPRWIEIGRMKAEDAERHIATLEGVRATLQWLLDHEQVVRGAIKWARDPIGRNWLENYDANNTERADA